MKRADLHTHSLFSDGVYTPDELCRRAKFAGVEVLSITDHDTMNGLDEKRAAAKKYGLSYVDGWEISAYEGQGKIHVLGYGCECGEAYQKFTDGAKAKSADELASAVTSYGDAPTHENYELLESTLISYIYGISPCLAFAVSQRMADTEQAKGELT